MLAAGWVGGGEGDGWEVGRVDHSMTISDTTPLRECWGKSQVHNTHTQ